MIEDLKSIKEQWNNTSAELRAIVITIGIIVGIIAFIVVLLKWPTFVLISIFLALVGAFCYSIYMVVLLTIKY